MAQAGILPENCSHPPTKQIKKRGEKELHSSATHVVEGLKN